ncbi:MAG TPA: class I SAM-dependent methyltransferase [Acidimicrobiales bacterium]|nr:class I SAM-dependent methyltransferase [Acidimicrobiales bacterium]
MSETPDSSAVRTALWRALHVQVDPPPHLIADEIGLQLADPPDGWQARGDMHPQGTGPYRIGIVARTRFVEDVVVDEQIGQYVLLGAGLDTFAQRHRDLADRVHVFEIDDPGTQAWKRQRLDDLGYGVPANLHLVPVDFETTGDWWGSLLAAGFHPTARALVSSSGVSMYITKEATGATLRQLAAMAPGSVLAMTFMVPLELVDAAERPGLEAAARGAEASGTPWISFYTPGEIVALADDAGFAATETVTTVEIADRYLAGRSDGLRAASGERILIART